MPNILWRRSDLISNLNEYFQHTNTCLRNMWPWYQEASKSIVTAHFPEWNRLRKHNSTFCKWKHNIYGDSAQINWESKLSREVLLTRVKHLFNPDNIKHQAGVCIYRTAVLHCKYFRVQIFESHPWWALNACPSSAQIQSLYPQNKLQSSYLLLCNSKEHNWLQSQK